MRDFRNWVDHLRGRGCLEIISREVDLRFEVAAVAKKLDGRACAYFKAIKGFKVPLVANVLFNREAMAEAM